ncbi:MAG: energy transducer TonB [Bacteroidota bacterium]|nr:energy transducer TonB [Bacteroidota bacterium]
MSLPTFPFWCVPARALLSGLLLTVAFAAAGQQAPAPAAVYTYVEQLPMLPGKGRTTSILAAVQQQVAYPPRALRDGLAGKVFVALTVAPDGFVTDTKVTRGLRADCDSAALAAVQRLPRLVPARQHGRAVYYSFTLPVSFLLPPATGK